MKRDKLILFGAGRNGILALKKYGSERIAFFCDNSTEKQGTRIEGVLIISFEEMLGYYRDGYNIMITPENKAYLIGQLELEGIYDYLLFQNEETRYIFSSSDEKNAYENEILDTLVERSRKLDLLSDVSEFSELSADALQMSKERNFFLAYHGMHRESDFYGNLQALLRYAGISQEEKKYFPIVSHAGCALQYEVGFNYKSSVILAGQYYREKIHKRAPYVPVFTVGPYIHYAEGIYDHKQIENVKKRSGKTILVFLPHSIENVERNYGKVEFINKVIQEYKNQFQSIWLCIYWADINDFICKYAESIGIHIVTAGFRFDSQFNCRLKSILEIADAVVCGDQGTFVSYALHMGKPIGRLDISDNSTITELSMRSDVEKKLQLNEEYMDNNKCFMNLFDSKLKNSERQKEWMNPVSGFDQVRDKEYIRNILDISKDIWNQCNGDLLYYPEAVRKVYFIYDKHAEFGKMTILKEAVGAFVD